MKKSKHHLHGYAILMHEKLQHAKNASCYSAGPEFFLSGTKADLKYQFVVRFHRVQI